MAWNSAKAMMTDTLQEGDLIPITMFQRIFRHVWPFSPEDFRRPEMHGNS